MRQINSDNPDVCPSCRALVIADVRTGIPGHLSTWFKNAKVIECMPLPHNFKGDTARVVDAL